MCRVTRHHTRKHHISTEELEAKLSGGIHEIRHYVDHDSRVLRYLGHVFRMGAARTRTQTGLHLSCSAVGPPAGWWMASSLQVKLRSFTISAVQPEKLLDEVGLSLLDAANKSEWHNILVATETRGARCSGPQARTASTGSLRFPAQVAAKP
jgi:hypothetical protein